MSASSFAVAPAPRGVPLVDTTPALTKVDKRFARSPTGGADGPGVEVDVDGGGTDGAILLSILTLSYDWN